MKQEAARNKYQTFRCSEEEKAQISAKRKRAGLTLQKSLLRCALDKEIIDPEGLHDLLHEMKKQGVNLNQLAHDAKRYGGCDNGQLEETLTEVRETWRLLRRWLRTYL